MAFTLDVVGAGVIGLSVAWRATQRGWAVRVFDPWMDKEAAPGKSASWVAGGMLAPFSEAWPGQESLVKIGKQSLLLWPEFSQGLIPYSPTGTVLAANETLLIGATAADLAALEPGLDVARQLGWGGQRHTRSSLREMEPGLAAEVRGGWWIPEEPAVDNRALLRALQSAVQKAGTQLIAQSWNPELSKTADATVVASGVRAKDHIPDLAIRAVKGEIVRLGVADRSRNVVTRTIRALVRGRSVYLVPRNNGVVVGATEWEGDNEVCVSAQSVVDLLSDAIAIMPGLADFSVLETNVGFRPVTPDRCPLVGRFEVEGIRHCFAAAGHGRDGMLLAPLTATLIVKLLAEEKCSAEEEEILRVMDPTRFSLR